MHLEPTEAWCLLRICAGIVAGFLLVAHLIKIKKNVPLFYYWLGAIAVLGGAAAFFLPIAVNSGFAKDDDGSALRQAILYTTGGLLAVITLGETHRKNNQEKEKNEKDHTREVHAERRSRYTTAVGQLANEKAAVRLGGIYTLVGLVDEWLADDPLGQKEGQAIINNLCAYVRSPFPLAALRQDLDKYASLTEDDIEKPNNNPRAIFLQEQGIRIAIFTEISKRLENSANNHEDASELWNKFKYNFREADIFYPLVDMHFSSPDFSGAKFYGNTSFSSSKFIGDANFKFAVYEGITSFLDVTFEGTANFHRAKFAEKSSFAGASFNGGVDFNRPSYNQEPLFKDEVEGEIHQAKFSYKTDPKEYKYTDKESEMKTIKTKDIEYKNKTYTIPLEAVLYNPDSPSASTIS